ncbi:hypothetical protein C8A00DRAFT_44787 [Chaetomidium leptoderma]|uniref:Uncharacterized protein n=1 Tax=Chaetomidium leptoderma TaxID=669021 RepID=A0AAN6VIV1_9PEZI|nr:hypothetical protein C8A00DRAFT_44787 [Chaetomidium leptoderma]
MDSFIPMGGVQLPAVHRRLSRLYNDTKKSSDFVKEPAHHAEADPETKSLHRKLRIQKDRLVSWGLEWSDPNQSAEVLIDSSLSKAGLSEVVGSIMSTIKDILAEAEPLWNSSRRLAGERVEPEAAPRRGEKIRMVVWDKNRFEDLIRDLTTSIDTLYDLSRTRSSYAQPSAAVRQLASPSPAAEDLRPFESSRIQTPQHIDPASLTNLRSMQAEPMTELAAQEHSREIVFMTKQDYAELTQTTAGGRQPHAPLLLEYASFDSIYSMTGISPPMARFEKVSAGLQAEPQRSPGSWTGLPRLLGYFEDMDNSRFGLVYQFPRTFNPVTFEHLTQNPLYNLCSLADLLARPDFEPKLEAKFRLAANLANTVFDMHARGITHGNVVGDNISFCNAVGTDPEVSGITQGEVDIRRPLISAFDLFSDPQSQDAPKPFSLYKHPLDPRNSAQSPLASNADSKTFDLYSLAMVLLSVGLWTKLENLVPNMDSPTLPETVLTQLAIRCGTLYMKAVQSCMEAVEQEMTTGHTTEQIVSRVQLKASRYLEACCILDGVSNLDERLGDDLGEPRPDPQPTAGPSKSEKSRTIAESRPAPSAGPAEAQVQSEAHEESAKPSKKMRLYPHIALPPEIIDKWNTLFMPQINSALRHFYRKNPESVEISLESIGESPQMTRPTVLVVCTSVSKVKAILKKKLGGLFDGTAGVALKVCRGQVLRSRKQPSRSMAKSADDGPEEVVAANPDFQERPKNGASIGAWIGDRHLPPVSLGGIITVDDKQYGMTVHHMLDDPDQAAAAAAAGKDGAPRSMAGPRVPDLAAWYAEQSQQHDSDPDSSGSEDYACEFSDSDSDTLSESAITSDYSDDEDEEDEQYTEPGDIPGVEPGCGEGYIITQPALDDVPDGFYPSTETEDEDHLDTYTVGEVYASSGLKRRNEHGLLHEIDWALFEFNDDRVPEGNLIPHIAQGSRRRLSWESEPPDDPVMHPTSVVPTSSLPGLQVQCMARTSGLQSGLILHAVASVKICGRASPSQIYQVTQSQPTPNNNTRRSALPMGIPGDSGAWVVDRDHGAVCGHILAWSERKRVAYICPMDVLLLDIAETLEANEIRLPGGEVIFSRLPMRDKMGRTLTQSSRLSRLSEQVSDLGDEGDDEEPPTVVSPLRKRQSSRRSQLSHRGSYRPSSIAAAGNDDEDSYDEAVEVALQRDVKELQLSETEMRK